MRALIACGVDVNAAHPKYRVTALEHALYRDDQTAVRILLDAGARTDHADMQSREISPAYCLFPWKILYSDALRSGCSNSM